MPKTKKSTKKFIKNRLSNVLEKRKKAKKIKQTRQVVFIHGVDLIFRKISTKPKEEANEQISHSESDTEQILDNPETLMDSEDSDQDDEPLQDQLDRLKDFDPEFYEYLKENDQELLDFKEDDKDLEEEELSTPEQDVMSSDISMEQITYWVSQLEAHHSLKSLKKLLSAFKAAAFTDEEQENQVVLHEQELDEIIWKTLEHAPKTFMHHLGKTTKGLPSTLPKWKKLTPLIKSFLSNSTRLLKQWTDSDTLAQFIKETQANASYVACYPKLSKEWIRLLLHHWAFGQESVRIQAFLSLRHFAVSVPCHLERIFKGAYKEFSRVSSNTSVHSWTNLAFMSSCLIEFAGLDWTTTYQQGFVAIRELAILLRGCISQKTKDSFKQIYSWPFLHRLRVWSMVLVTYIPKKGSDVLTHLIYPFVQIAMGVLQLKSSSKYFPMRFHIIKLLLDISKSTGTFIPCASMIFEVFESHEMTSKPKPSTLKPLDMKLNIKAPKGYLSSKVYQNGLIDECIHLLYSIYSSMAYSISFPELIVPGVIYMKRYIKKSRNMSLNKQIQTLVEKLEQNSAWILQHRSKIDFSPKDLEKAAQFSLELTDSPLVRYETSRRKIEEQMNAQKDIKSSEMKQEMEEDSDELEENESVVEGEEDLVQDFVL